MYMKTTKTLFFTMMLTLLSRLGEAATYYVSPTGSDANTGAIGNPWGTIQYAVNKAVAGDIIYLRNGTYQISTQINITPNNSGTSTAPIKLWAYNGEKPILDFSTQPFKSALRGFLITGDYWHFKGLEIAYADDNGIKIEGNYNIIEFCVFHHCGDTGLQLGFGHTTNPDNPGNLCAYNKIINCDSYRNFDFAGKGGNADGFACKMHNGKGNVFTGCRAWENSDDGWDLFETNWPVEISYCWAWHSGDKLFFEDIYLQKMGSKLSSFSGNGNGIKLGGNGTGGNSVGIHIASHCVAFNNNKTTSVKGFDQNNHSGGVYIEHCLAWNNGYNFMFETAATSGNSNTFINNVSIKGTRNDYEIVAGSTETNNTWNLVPALLAEASDYVVLTEEAAKAPRQADGSLPDNGFARLVAGSDLIDKGAVIPNQTYFGKAPDLGPYEYKDQVSAVDDHTSELSENGLYPNPFHDEITIKQLGAFVYDIYNMQGIVLDHGSAENQLSLGQTLAPGFYMIKIRSGSSHKGYQIQKTR